MRITMIAAMDRARAIGRANAMPWHLPDDFRRFKALTVGKPVIMGRRTAMSIGRALPDRPNIVLSRSSEPPFPGQTPARSLGEAIALATDPLAASPAGPAGPASPASPAGPRAARPPATTADPEASREARPGPPRTSDIALDPGPEIMIAGGGEVYDLFLPMATDMRLTFVDGVIDSADAFFPAWDPAEWREISRERHGADDRHGYAFDWVWLVR